MSIDDLYLPDDNLYLELDLFLDPAILDFNALKIELGKKMTEWNKLANAPGPEGTKLKHRVQVAEKIRKEPKPSNLFAMASKARKKRETEGRKTAAYYEEDGILEQREVDALIKEFGKYFKEPTIKSWFTLEVTPPFVAPSEPSWPEDVKKKIVDKSKMGQFAADLKIVLGNENASLYDLLGLPQTADLKTIQETCRAASDKASKKPKTGPGAAKVDAEIRVLGQAKMVFGDEISRQGYDIAVKRRPFDMLVDTVFQKRALKGSVTHDEYVRSIEDARRVGFTPAEAEWHVYDYYCVKHKPPCKPPQKQIDLPPRQQCPVCNDLNDINARYCRCGIPLKINCPRCKREGSFGDKACTQCAFPLGNMPIALKRIELAKHAIVEKKTGEAEEHLRHVNEYWEDAPGTDEVRRALDELKARMEAVARRVREIESKIKDALGKKFLYEAKRLSRELRQIPEASMNFLEEEKLIDQSLDEVRKNLTALASVTGRLEKEELCETILAVAADCVEAKTIRDQIPPAPPEQLVATVVSTGIELKWIAPASRSSLTYLVVRKSGGTPASTTDGDRLCEGLTHPVFVDTTVEPGIVYGYAVYTQRDQIVETTGCRSNVVQKIEDIRHLSILPGDGSLTVFWKKQPGCREMIVTRFPGNTPDGNGVRIPLQHETSFVDSNLENGTTYSYRIQTVFQGIDGKGIVSPGKIVSGKPQIPPQAVVDLSLEESSDPVYRNQLKIPGDVTRVSVFPEDKRTRTPEISMDCSITLLRWSIPQQGDVFLFDMAIDPEIPVGKVEWTTPTELKKHYGEAIPILGKGQTLWKNTSAGVRYILPVTFLDGLAVFGKPASMIRMTDVSDLDLHISGDNLRLSWSWPKGLQKVLIVYGCDKYPDGPNDHQAAKVTLTRQEYDMEKSWLFADGGLNEYYFCVYAFVEYDSRQAFSRGVRIQTAKTVIKYDLSICRMHGLWGPIGAKIILTIDSGQEELPDLVVKRDVKRPPLNRDFGVPLIEIPAQPGQKVIVPLSADWLEEGSYIKLFVKDPGEAERYVIDSPPREKLHLYFKKPTLFQLFHEMFAWFFKK
ncbi:MAG: hypothetical protein FWC50_09085 [Planctomycetaceae bacterium]|nr:hypothetical protein [Planctomycetaceae bacterium]